MSEKVARIFRRQANEAAKQAVGSVVPGVNAALQNEQLTRARVDALEQAVLPLTAWRREKPKETRWEKLKWLLASGK